jgi:hypothetical protein
MEPDVLPRPSDDVVYQQLEGEVVLVHLRTNKIFALNPTAARFWELLVQGSARAEIEEQLAAEFSVDRNEVEREIDTLLAALAAEHLVT